jgi:hypothetical protein
METVTFSPSHSPDGMIEVSIAAVSASKDLLTLNLHASSPQLCLFLDDLTVEFGASGPRIYCWGISFVLERPHRVEILSSGDDHAFL